MKKFKSSVTSKLTKVTSMILVALMTVSLAGCGGQTAQKDNRMTTEDLSTESKVDVDIKEPRTDVDPGVDVTETTTEEPTTEEPTTEATTEAPGDNSGVDNGDGTWSYTVYGDIVVTLPVNIDDYIFVDTLGYTSINLAEMSGQFGWTIPHEDEDNYFTYQYSGDGYTIDFYFDYYHDRVTGVFDDQSYQIESCSYCFSPPNPNDSMYSIQYRNVDLRFGQRSPEDLKYCLFPGFMISVSRDDAIMIAYLITFVKYHPGENPFYYLQDEDIASYRGSSTTTDVYVFR